MTYKEFFEHISRLPPKVSYIPAESGVTGDFWEKLYQAFKERMTAESNIGSPEQSKPISSVAAKDTNKLPKAGKSDE